MGHGIVIIGPGLAACQLAKDIRKQDANISLILTATDNMDEYSKLDLSHVVSRSQYAGDFIHQLAGEFAE